MEKDREERKRNLITVEHSTEKKIVKEKNEHFLKNRQYTDEKKKKRKLNICEKKEFVWV